MGVRVHMPRLAPGVKPVGPVVIDSERRRPACCFVNEWVTGLGAAGLDFSVAGTTAIKQNNLQLSNGAAPAIADKSLVEGQSQLTVVAKFKWDALGNRDGVFGHVNAGGFSLNLGYSNPADLFMYCGTTDNYTPEFEPISGAVVAGEWRTFVLVFDGSLAAADRVQLFIDGVHETSWSWAAAPGTTTPSNANNWGLCGGNEASIGEMEFFYVEQTAFPDALALAVSKDPYQFLKPATPDVYIDTTPPTPNDRVWII